MLAQLNSTGVEFGNRQRKQISIRNRNKAYRSEDDLNLATMPMREDTWQADKAVVLDTFSAEEEQEPTQAQIEESVQAWMRRAGDVSLLTHEQEIALARRIEEASTRSEYDRARNALISANLRLVASVARRYQGHSIPFEDLVQEGTIGLVGAVERFRYQKGFRFSTYAIWWIRQAITRAITEQSRMIRLPAHIMEGQTRLRKTRDALQVSLGRTPNCAEIAEAMGMNEDQLFSLQQGTPSSISLETPVGDEGDSRLADLIPAPETDNPAAEASRSAQRAELLAALDVLTPREKEIILLRYGLTDAEPCTLEEASRALRVTRQRVLQLETFALKKLRKFVTKPGVA